MSELAMLVPSDKQLLALLTGSDAWLGIHPAPKTLRSVALEVCAKHGISLEALRGPSRLRKFVLPRHEFMARAYDELPKASFPRIGRFLGGRDHTTAIAGRRRHMARIEKRALG